MSVQRAKGDRGRADILFSRIVRSRGACERCGRTPATDTAHIVRRMYSATRCVEDNAWALCSSCHRATERWPMEFAELVKATIGVDRYHELREMAYEGLKARGFVSSKLFWAREVARLQARCKELGLPSTRKVSGG